MENIEIKITNHNYQIKQISINDLILYKAIGQHLAINVIVTLETLKISKILTKLKIILPKSYMYTRYIYITYVVFDIFQNILKLL